MLREIRKQRGYTLQELASLSGITYQQIQGIETGKFKIENITVKTFFRLCKALEVEPWELYKEG